MKEKITALEILSNYNNVLRLVKKGYTIQKAYLTLNITKSTLYKNLTEQQKNELKSYKLINSNYYKTSKYHSKF